ncbi:hypothetical protein HDU76_007625, partial [Blyttiomyces sp. JEL0837]
SERSRKIGSWKHDRPRKPTTLKGVSVSRSGVETKPNDNTETTQVLPVSTNQQRPSSSQEFSASSQDAEQGPDVANDLEMSGNSDQLPVKIESRQLSYMSTNTTGGKKRDQFSAYHTVVRVIESKLLPNTHVADKSIVIPEAPRKSSIKAAMLEIIEKAITILNHNFRTVESIGLDSIASMTSDNFSTTAATIFTYIILGTNSSWTSWKGPCR